MVSLFRDIFSIDIFLRDVYSQQNTSQVNDPSAAPTMLARLMAPANPGKMHLFKPKLNVD